MAQQTVEPQSWMKTFQKDLMKWLVRIDKFIKQWQSVLLIIVFIISVIALIFSLTGKSREVGMIEQGFIETCQAERDQDFLDKSCVKRILKHREVREAPDITSHLKDIEDRVTLEVKSESDKLIKTKTDQSLTDLKNKNKENFNGWKDEMNQKVDSIEFVKKIVDNTLPKIHVPKPIKQFDEKEESDLKGWAPSAGHYKNLLEATQHVLNMLAELRIDKSEMQELKHISEDSKELKQTDGKSGLLTKIDDLVNPNGPIFPHINGLKGEQNTLKGNVESLTNKYYNLQATSDIKGGKEPLYLGMIGIAVISFTSLFLSIYSKGSSGESRRQNYQPAFQRDHSPEPNRHPSPSATRTPSLRTNSVLSGVQRKRCANILCVVSFYKETQRTHQRIITSVLYGTRYENLPIESVIINKHEQIKDLPGAKVYCVFVDYNQRHVILENPDLGLGDLRLTTVKGCKKIGGEVAVLYVGDDGSRQIPHGQLFNSSLTSVYQHEELRNLNERQRFFSVHQTLNQQQIQVIQQFLMQNLDST